MKRCKSCHAPITFLPDVKICIGCGDEKTTIIYNHIIFNWLITLKNSLHNVWKNTNVSAQKIGTEDS